MINKEKPIGLFDSGVGGTTIWKEIVKLMPYENTLFLADNKNAPYGGKTKEEIIVLCERNTEFLLENKVKIIVVACNTGTTNAISHLRSKYKDISFIGIEPAIKPAGLQSVTKKVGVLATKGTLSSELFMKTSNDLIKKEGIQIVEKIGEGLVNLIEKGQIESPEIFELLKKYLLPMAEENIDYLVLGCTHYPYLLPQIQKIIPENIKVIDSGYAVAKQTKNVLSQSNLLNDSQRKPHHIWFSNGNLSVLQQFAPNIDNLKLQQI
ncbi:glutamate racemase [Capnocytophaga felis]|uniref:Glutamate racemase n=1 Tax=Capnocytophaga felis TaxID=2267611 RepID=A0A5M4B9N9_9FLAO|nr:glutamate racemase [Capnocytophaga felis]GET46324.1 glutamate racemase [Capnocytophaga felis]GET48154.1 glutamate racemase [Capnocytophaga felis]